MIKTLTSLFAIYHFASTQAPPQWVQIPSTKAPVIPPQPQPIVTTRAPPVIITPPVVIIPNPTQENPTQSPVTKTPTKSPVTFAPSKNPTTAMPTRPLLPPNQFWGKFDQICDFTYSPLKDVVCKAEGQHGMEQYPGFMKCERGYDCCLCDTINCGNQWTGCNTFSSGDSGVFGVKNINIIGRTDANGGANINCIGTEACANSVINAQNIKQIDASGDLSLWNAIITVTNPVSDFALDCIGTQGCRGAKLLFIISGPPPGYMCNPKLVAQVIEWNGLKCSGIESCKDSEITVKNLGCHSIDIQQIECVKPNSCMNTKFNFIGDVTINNCDISNAQQIPVGLNMCLAQGQPQNPQAPYQPWLQV